MSLHLRHPMFTSYESRRSRAYDDQRATFAPRVRSFHSTNPSKMPSSKGEPTDPELREQVKEEVKGEQKGTLTIHHQLTLPEF